MTIYSPRRPSTKIHRKIFESHYGSIPKEEDGRSYEIHHIDYDPMNNDASNLTAVTIQEHYDIHYRNGDWGACMGISVRMSKPPHTISELASLNNAVRVKAGIHNLQKRPDGSSLTGDTFIAGRTHIGVNNPRYDYTVYSFVNVVSSLEVNMTQHDFVTKFNLSKSAVCYLIKQLRGHKSVKGWELKITKPDDSQ